jgi:hypothetical protein
VSRTVLSAPVRAPKPRKQTPLERQIEVEHIRARDKGCVLHQIVPDHVCKGQWGGEIIPWDAVELMTIEHVKEGLGGFKPGTAATGSPVLDRRHAVLACYHSNSYSVETSKYREEIRKWIADHEPPEAVA